VHNIWRKSFQLPGTLAGYLFLGFIAIILALFLYFQTLVREVRDSTKITSKIFAEFLKTSTTAYGVYPTPNPEMEMAKEKHQLEIEQAQLDSMETMGKMQLMKAQVNKVITDTERTAGQHMNDQQRLQMDQIQQQMDAIVAVSELELARRQLEITKTTAQRHLNGKPSQ